MTNRLKLKAVFITSIVFALGALVGASWGTIVVSRKIAFAEVPEDKSRPGMIERFQSRLKLSPEQTQRLQAILDETHREFGRLHEAVKPQFEEIRQRMRSRIRQMLKEEQKREYETMIRERQGRKPKRPSS
jgi:septal ring factor EnvC (AmiA/AmiB activator)